MSSFTIDNILSPAFSSKRKLNDSIQENSNQLRSPFQPITPNFNQINPVAFFTFASLAYKSSPNSPYLNSSGYSSTSSSVSFIDASTQEEEIDIEDDSDDNIEVSLSHRNPKREKKEWVCPTCQKVFDRPSLLQRHIRVHTGEKPHACDVCGKAFSTSSSLNTHVRIHSGEKPHECNTCGKKFTASSNLYYHKLTHTTEKPHKCDRCSKSFSTPGDLRAHMHTHNGTWPFKCDLCSKGFTKQTNLKNHMLTHSGAKPFSCLKCDKQFSLACNLKSHVKTHHGENDGALDESSNKENESFNRIKTEIN